ncbi:hypothetical protein KUD11_06595 [Roseovarius sp. LXJ103]|uniref:hypothetical protein n=1 Tax=Roseovarius carneus TaxID=2853164 RepID=UPI000D613002|nr:hypothetical protein [Roseovarius carneus]MBZ8118314.1 hypothetical protein [Roseovarius carneus]PWE35967.1 hypothetical protein DD563_08365 [Pelagicola sp. LXJ1103]
MNAAQKARGGAPVGRIADLDAVEAAAVIYFRLWCDGAPSRSQVEDDFCALLGPVHGKSALTALGDMLELCARHGRRPLMRHGLTCTCLGADEACFANFIASAACGPREDALMMAMLIVRPDVAPVLTAMATQFGLALSRMQLSAPSEMRARAPKAERVLH